MLLADLPWKLARHLPWHIVKSPIDQWRVMPSFLIGEYLFIGCAIAALVHAFRQGDERRKHVLVWVLALLAGTANDMIFMALPLVNNFWQAQATIMITPRLPLYIPCVYICFMYFSTVSAWRLRLSPFPRAALTGLAAALFYGPYDIVGAKFLWWTWHDTDPPIANRILGAPIGSTMWILTFTAAFSWLAGRVVDRDPAVSRRTIAKGVALVCGLTTLLMMVQMTVLQQIDGGTPGVRGLVLVCVVFAALAAVAARRTKPAPPRAADRILGVAAVTYFAVLVGIMAVFDPATHRSESVHQTYGPCHVVQTDITGASRFEFLCAEDYDEDFTFACVDRLPAEGAEWYTVCGKPHTSFARWMLGVSALGLVGSLLYAYMLGLVRRPSEGS